MPTSRVLGVGRGVLGGAGSRRQKKNAKFSASVLLGVKKYNTFAIVNRLRAKTNNHDLPRI